MDAEHINKNIKKKLNHKLNRDESNIKISNSWYSESS